MEHHDPSTLLASVETIHWIALAIMAEITATRYSKQIAAGIR